MTNQDLNRELAERLGLLEHIVIAEHDERAVCSCGVRGLAFAVRNHCINSIPDFTTDAGAVKLLRLLMQREDWPEFMRRLNTMLRPEGMKDLDILLEDVVTSLFRQYITTPGLLAKKAAEWFSHRKEK